LRAGFLTKNAGRGRGARLYSLLIQVEFGKTLPFFDGRFAAFISFGVFTAGHAPASSLFELVQILKLGGFAVFTVRDSTFESRGFRDVFCAVRSAGHVACGI
jgi:hypothetical protein